MRTRWSLVTPKRAGFFPETIVCYYRWWSEIDVTLFQIGSTYRATTPALGLCYWNLKRTIEDRHLLYLYYIRLYLHVLDYIHAICIGSIHQPFHTSIYISTLPTQHTTFISLLLLSFIHVSRNKFCLSSTGNVCVGLRPDVLRVWDCYLSLLSQYYSLNLINQIHFDSIDMLQLIF